MDLMKSVAIIIPHYKTWKWTAICVNAFKRYSLPIPHEIIVVNNSPGHRSIEAVMETNIGNGVTFINGDPEFTSHGMGYDIGLKHALENGHDWIFTSETDSFPTRHGWFDEYVKFSGKYKMMGPEIPQSAGRYIHPAGALYKREVIELAMDYREQTLKDWIFYPCGAIPLGISNQGYHAVVHKDLLPKDCTTHEIEIWKRAGVFQEMRSFDEDDFETYPQRRRIYNFEPSPGKGTYKKIGYEAGQWLSYFAQAHYNILCAPTEIEWMPGRQGQQASRSLVFGGFMHCWCGTVSNLDNGIAPEVRIFKLAQQEQYFQSLGQDTIDKILAMEKAAEC
jgi:hypothetical protein